MIDCEASVRYYQLHTKVHHFRAWRAHFDLLMKEQRAEAQAREQQAFIKAMNEQAEAELEAERMRVEAEKIAAEERRKAEKLQEKQQQAYW